MPSLDQVIRSIISHPKEIFFRDLKEMMNTRLSEKKEETYEKALKCFFEHKIADVEPIAEALITEKKAQVEGLLKTLKESLYDSKTILHKFKDGNSVAISPDDSFSLIQMHDNLNIINQEKMRNLMSESFAEYNKILKFSKKHRKDNK